MDSQGIPLEVGCIRMQGLAARIHDQRCTRSDSDTHSLRAESWKAALPLLCDIAMVLAYAVGLQEPA